MEKFQILTPQESAMIYGASASFWAKLLQFLLKFGDAILEGILRGWKEAQKNE